MALTIDKTATALLIMDCENDIVHREGKGAKVTGLGEIVEQKGTLRNIRKVLDAARQTGVAVIYMTVDNDRTKLEEWPKRGQFFEKVVKMLGSVLQKGTWGAEIHEEVKPLQGELILGKSIVSAFSRSGLDAELKKRGVRDLILTGGGTHMVVESTARNAVDRGYSVITVEDGVAGSMEQAHQASLHMLHALGDVATSDEIVAALRS
jgi:nicotinamidase-related amidase